MKINLVLMLIAFTACTNDSIKESIESEPNSINEITTGNNKVGLFSDFDFFQLKGKTSISKNSTPPLVKVSYDEKGRVMSLQDSLGGSLSASPLIFNYGSQSTTARLQNTEEGAYVNLIFTDSVIIALYTYKEYVETMKKEAFYLNEVHVLRKNFTEDVFYFKPQKLIVKGELDFKFEYLNKYDRKDSKIYIADKNKLTISTKSTLGTENKKSCYDCGIPFSSYWWFFYGSLIYQETICTAN